MATFPWNGWPWCAMLFATCCAATAGGRATDAGPAGTDASAAVVGTAPLSASCSIDGKIVDCSIALWDMAIGLDSVPTGATPRSYCEHLCSHGAHVPLESDAIIDAGGACRHATRIRGLTCDDCRRLADTPVPLRCDEDPCTRDWCDGMTCFHKTYSWVGAICASQGCLGTLKCDPGACLVQPGCAQSGFRVCSGCPST